ncbi:hypothetical protein S2E19_04990 [Bacillus mycoides]|nr:hypothetical protein S2E19_04990 [Bacillus mycoides]
MNLNSFGVFGKSENVIDFHEWEEREKRVECCIFVRDGKL